MPLNRFISSLFTQVSDLFTSDTDVSSILNPFVILTLALVCMMLPKKYQLSFFIVVSGVLLSGASRTAQSLVELQPVSAHAIQHNLEVETVTATITEILDDGISDYHKYAAFDRFEAYRQLCDRRHIAVRIAKEKAQIAEDRANRIARANGMTVPTEDIEDPMDTEEEDPPFTFKSTIFWNGELRPSWAPVYFEVVCAPLRQTTSADKHQAASRQNGWRNFAQITNVRGIILPVHTSGRSRAQPVYAKQLNGRQDQVDRGHIFGLELGGPDIAANIVPQPIESNRVGKWRQLELLLGNLAIEGTAKKDKLKTVELNDEGVQTELNRMTDFNHLVHFNADIIYDRSNMPSYVMVTYCQFDPKKVTLQSNFYDYQNAQVTDYSQCAQEVSDKYNFETHLRLNYHTGKAVNAHTDAHPNENSRGISFNRA